MRVVYHLVIIPISWLPQGLQYLLARILCYILKNIIRYRRQLIEKNLAISFPHLSKAEKKTILKDFYWNISQVIIESISAFSLSKKEARERTTVLNPQVLDNLYDKGRDVIITGGHYANWEAITLTDSQIQHDLYALYKPLKNSFMDDKVQRSRSRFGVNMISIKDYRRYMEEPHDVPRAFIFGIDQSPRKDSGEWIDFLGRDTLVFTGPERLSKQYNLAVVAGQLTRVSTGQYHIEYETLFEHPKDTAENEITRVTMKNVEDLVLSNPSDWLWSHNRWKHKRNAGQ